MNKEATKEPIRFAPLIRVSTEKQEAKGESLTTQRKQINHYVELLGGVIPKECNKYSGQEHATPDQERTKLNQLLEDAKKGLFDAVIVCDVSRWSRDNQKSKDKLEILRDNNIRFFVGMVEYDLFDYNQNLFLGLSAEIGEFQAAQQSKKSIDNRIERAKRGIPTGGKIPFGRTYNKDTNTWGIDPDKKIIIEQAASRYLKGESSQIIAQSYGMNLPNLWKILTTRSGEDWEISFKLKRAKIDETVSIKVPRLLDDEVINKILEKAKANKTYTHGEIKNKYLLSRMIFCKKCGYAMFGYTNQSGNRYYRHIKKSSCTFTKFLKAEEIEASVLLHIVTTFGDSVRMERAVKQATPDQENIESLQREEKLLSKEYQKLDLQENRLVDAVSNGSLKQEQIKSKSDEIRQKKLDCLGRISSIKSQLADTPNPERVKQLTKLGKAVLKNATKGNAKSIFTKPYEWQRKLVENTFSGCDIKGNRLGVYVEYTGKKQSPFQIELKGIIEPVVFNLPLSDDFLMDVLNLNPEDQDTNNEIRKLKKGTKKTPKNNKDDDDNNTLKSKTNSSSSSLEQDLLLFRFLQAIGSLLK